MIVSGISADLSAIVPGADIQLISILYQNSTISLDVDIDLEGDMVLNAGVALLKLSCSAILTDLGQLSPSNLFAQPSALVKFITEHNTSQSWSDAELPFPPAPPPGADIRKFYKNQGTPLPLITPAVIATKYLCQVPQLKSTSSLLISILVADLVFLQVLWKLFNLVVASTLQRRHPDAKFCQGCAKDLHTGYSPVTQSDSSLQVEAGKGPGIELMKDSRPEVLMEARRESATEKDTVQERPARAITA